ncbi:MAG: DUF4326 domain-containing protein, partial [Gammaproteobacteria bacterium]
PTPWGNPYRVERDGTRFRVVAVYDPDTTLRWFDDEQDAYAFCVDLFRSYFLSLVDFLPRLRALRKYDALACWCAEHRPCHADVLIELMSKYLPDEPWPERRQRATGTWLDEDADRIRYGE